MITVTGLTKRYGDRTAVDDLTFAVADGRVTGFVGPNGAGKSTTMRMMVGLTTPDRGEVRYGGVRYTDLRHPARLVGTVLDPRCVHPGHTARNHLRAMAALSDIPFARVDQVLAEVAQTWGEEVGAVLANDPSLGNAYANYGGSWGQKTALVYKKRRATVLDAQLVYRTDLDPSWGSTFASRDPLEVHLRVDAPGGAREVWVLVVHLKALGDAASLAQRAQASDDLTRYLDQAHGADAVMVVGDWNDDLDSSIRSGAASPFANVLADPDHYRFATQPLSDAHTSTTADHTGHPIDHHLLSAPLFGNLQPDTLQLVQPTVASYATTTSDHYPVLVGYRFP